MCQEKENENERAAHGRPRHELMQVIRRQLLALKIREVLIHRLGYRNRGRALRERSGR